MDKNEIIFRLQIIALLDSLSYGLLYVFISPYLMQLGGDQVTIGIFTVVTLIFQLMSIHIVSDMVKQQGQKAALLNIFNIAAFTHALLYLSTNTCFLIMARCVYSSTNQSTNLIKDYIVKNIPPDRNNYHMNVYHILHSSGYIIGPAVTGALFDISFTISCVIAALLNIINIWLLTSIPGLENSPSEPSDVPTVRRVRQSVERRIVELKHPNSKHNWDLLAIKYLFGASVITFSTKYSMVLKHNYHTSHTEIGLVTSYMNIVIYAAIYYSSTLRSQMNQFTRAMIISAMFGVLFTSTILALYSPVLSMFCLMCIPVTFSRIIITDTWETFLSERGHPGLVSAVDSANILAGLTVPLIFGVLANHIGHQATIIFSIYPVLSCILVMHYFTKTSGENNQRDQSDDCPAGGRNLRDPTNGGFCPARCSSRKCSTVSFCVQTNDDNERDVSNLNKNSSEYKECGCLKED